MNQALRQPHEHVRGGTAKLLTLLHPVTGMVQVKGVISSANVVLHPWLQEQLSAIMETLPPVGPVRDPAANRAQWERWQDGLSEKFTLMQELPPWRMLLIWDNLAGHKTPEMVCWLMRHGIMPLYTPLGGSWLNMAESVQRILTRRALSGQQPHSSAELIAWLDATARAWNRQPTPFVWGGARHARRERARQRRRVAYPWLHALGGSGACSTEPIAYARAAQG
jgi:DDE superfamily endonuclease